MGKLTKEEWEELLTEEISLVMTQMDLGITEAALYALAEERAHEREKEILSLREREDRKRRQ